MLLLMIIMTMIGSNELQRGFWIMRGITGHGLESTPRERGKRVTREEYVDVDRWGKG